MWKASSIEGTMNSLGGLPSVGLNLITSQIPFFMSAGMQLLGALGTGLIQFVTGVFTGNWTQAWESVKSIFGSIFDSLGALVKQPINAIISIINRAISGINGLKLDMRYTLYRGLAQVSNWVRLKFAAMNLKKLAIWKSRRLAAPFCFLLSFLFPAIYFTACLARSQTGRFSTG